MSSAAALPSGPNVQSAAAVVAGEVDDGGVAAPKSLKQLAQMAQPHQQPLLNPDLHPPW